MRKKALILQILIVFLCTQCLALEDFTRINIREAMDIAAENNIDLKSQQFDIEIARNNIKSLTRWQNPELNTFWNFGKAGSGNPQQIGATQTIELFKRSARRKFAKSNLELTKENVNYAQFDLKMDVREAYIQLVAAKSVLKSLEGEKKLLEDLKNIAQKRAKAGAAPEMDVLQADIALNQMETQINSANANVKTAVYNFNKVLNAQSDKKELYDTNEDEFDMSGNFIGLMTPPPKALLPDFIEISDAASKNRFDLKIAKKEIDVAKSNLSLVARQRIPDIELQAGYGFQTKGMSDDGTFQSGGYAGASLVNLPLFYNYSPEIKNAKLELEQARLKYLSAQNKAHQDLNIAYEKFVSAKLNLNFYNDSLLKNSQEMMKLSKRSYEVGKSNLTSLIVMEQSYKAIIVGYTYALAYYYNCWIDFLREVDAEEFSLSAENI